MFCLLVLASAVNNCPVVVSCFLLAIPFKMSPKYSTEMRPHFPKYRKARLLMKKALFRQEGTVLYN